MYKWRCLYIYFVLNLFLYMSICFVKNDHISFGKKSPNLIARNLFFGQNIESNKNEYPPTEFDTISPRAKKLGRCSDNALYDIFDFKADMLQNVDITNCVINKLDSIHSRENCPDFFDILIKCPSVRELKTYRWMKYMHDKNVCNRINEGSEFETGEYWKDPPVSDFEPLKSDNSLMNLNSEPDTTINIPDIIKSNNKGIETNGNDIHDGSEIKTKNEATNELNKPVYKKKVVGYDNSGYYSNVLILLNADREILKRRCEALRLDNILGLTNTDVMQLLIASQEFLMAPKNFKNTVNFLIAFGRANLNLQNDDYKLWEDLPNPPKCINVPSIYAMIGRKQMIAPKFMWKRRRSKSEPYRDKWPISTPDTPSALSRWLNSAESLYIHTTKGVKHVGTALNDFDKHFPNDKHYNTSCSINRYDCATSVDFLGNMGKMLKCVRRQKVAAKPIYSNNYTFGINDLANEDDNINVNNWSKADIRKMLLKNPLLGLRRTRTLINCIRNLHEVMGFSYKEILALGIRYPSIFTCGDYKNHVNAIYDSDRDFTYKDVFYLIKKLPYLLTSNIPRSIRPKIYYIRRIMGKTIDELLEYPQYLSFSLRDRIMPRHYCLMNLHYQNKFDKVYKYLFCTGLHHSYGTLVEDETLDKALKLPKDLSNHLTAYYKLNQEYKIRDLLSPGDDLFCKIFNVSWRDLVIAKEKSMLIPTPQDLP
ncbi:hypothetical protein BMR1_03g04022 [Babesia microti strain RI]|uniref:mTERF domain-containing protein 1, mitochondrial n=1 Tax=Babesia microti (strain RI) TaxID=1133968 RepID=A0A1R4AC91_BABMR|nr:hypothetical protein BMR1_03g04022 [Babesia microti strain RI]SJK86633.1 hypothetical protein BMR1_03g04022 [Babesia microti strain RI]|eukprot:XP_021338768.1 hypothetical protein BMR1_03g04022 [Babesia microti strain RI]